MDRPPSPPTLPLAENPVPSGEEISHRAWPRIILGLLLFLQAAGLLALGLLQFVLANFLATLAHVLELSPSELMAEMVQGSVLSIIYVPLSLLGLVAGIGFLRRWPNAWANAVLLQGLSLLIALILYFQQKPFYVYLIMLYGIFMVAYLYYSDVQVTFQSGEEEDSV